MLRYLTFTFLIAVILVAALHAADSSKHNYTPKEGYVPDEKTAIKIAVAVWIPIYGEQQIEKEKPYHAVLSNGVWFVKGSLPYTNSCGGVAEAEISRNDGRILRIIHWK